MNPTVARDKTVEVKRQKERERRICGGARPTWRGFKIFGPLNYCDKLVSKYHDNLELSTTLSRKLAV